MSEKQTAIGGANTREFKRGVEAGLNSEDTKYWQAGFELGQEYSDKEAKRPVEGIIEKEPAAPLLLADTLDGYTGADQDEKDESAE